jgi:hypothetical protein
MISTAMFLELNILHMDILGKLQAETKQQVRSGLQACNCNQELGEPFSFEPGIGGA